MNIGDSPGFLINKLARFMMNELDRKMTVYGVTSSQWAVLAFLWQKEGITQKQLQELLGLDKATVTGIIQRMIKAGFIQRKQEVTDKRIRRIFLTIHGKELEHKLVPLAKEVNKLALSALLPEQREEFILLITQILRSLDR